MRTPGHPAIPVPDWNVPFRALRTTSRGGRRRRNSSVNVASRRTDMEDWEIRAALELHWTASDANDFETEHQIYLEDAVLDYPQSGERIRGRHNIQASRVAQPNKKHFTVSRILGAANL